MKLNTTKYKSEAILILVTLLWGGTFVIVKEALNDISSMAFIAVRFILAAIILLPFMKIKKFNSKNILAGIFLGVLLFAGFATQTVGLKYTAATKSGFLTGTAVIMVPFLQILIEKRMPTKGVIIGAIFVMIGIAFLSSGGNSIINLLEDLSTNFGLGELLTLICALFFAFYIIYLDVETSKYDFYVLLFLQIITTAVLSVLFLGIFSSTGIEPMKLNISTNLIWAVLYTSIFATLITTALQTKYQKNVTPAKAGIIFSFEPIFAAIFAFFVLGEKITNFGYLGAALIMLGLLISELYENLFLKNAK
ncbi:MAG: DMT family transporter [Ignavibacteriales bacterium]|nr:DMT family transporter [Ignavibacteriales bacterium]MCB9210215.1 DMT family transporter [Ignavibacteriales bacterium]